jgi:8-oxo-dGTP pyrophosphatase MutT (NUDIX family)
MGHIEEGETAVAAALREVKEEVGLSRPEMKGFWALEQVHPFFIARRDEIVLSPRFAAEVAPAWEPTLNDEHSAHRWISGHQAGRYFMWPGQGAAIREILESLLRPGALGERWLRVE